MERGDAGWNEGLDREAGGGASKPERGAGNAEIFLRPGLEGVAAASEAGSSGVPRRVEGLFRASGAGAAEVPEGAEGVGEGFDSEPASGKPGFAGPADSPKPAFAPESKPLRRIKNADGASISLLTGKTSAQKNREENKTQCTPRDSALAIAVLLDIISGIDNARQPQG